MIYIARFEDDAAIIYDGPVTYDGIDPHTLASADLADVQDSWELALLSAKEQEWPALRRNAQRAIARIERHRLAPHGVPALLDVGSGWGFFLAAAKEHGWDPFGLEPLPASSVYARSRFGVSVITDTLHVDSFPRGFFDIVTSFQVFEHLPDPARDIRILHALMRPGGLILLEVPHLTAWSARLLGPRHRHFVQDHVNFFSFATLGRLLEANGFAVVDRYRPTRYMSLDHLWRAWLSRYLPASIVGPAERLAERVLPGEIIIGVNVGDMIAMIARRV